MLEYKTLRSSELANSVSNNYNGCKLDFQDVSHIKTVQILTIDTKLSETINTPKVSPMYILFLFVDSTSVDSEEFVNPGVMSKT